MYTLEAKEPGRATCRVGWDGGLMTFFVYVARPLVTDKLGKPVGDKDGHLILHIGTECRELTSLKELESRIAPYAALAEDVKASLAADRERDEAGGGESTDGRIASLLGEVEGRSRLTSAEFEGLLEKYRLGACEPVVRLAFYENGFMSYPVEGTDDEYWQRDNASSVEAAR